MVTFQLRQWIEARPEDVWAVLTEHEGWTFWAGVGRVTLEQPGTDSRNGVGAIRIIRAPGATLREQVTVFEAPTLFEYTILTGAPVRDYVGSLRLEERPHGTLVHWHVSFRPRVPGTGRVVSAIFRTALRFVPGRLGNRMAPLEKHRTECPYGDGQDGRPRRLSLTGRSARPRRGLLRRPRER